MIIFQHDDDDGDDDDDGHDDDDGADVERTHPEMATQSNETWYNLLLGNINYHQFQILNVVLLCHPLVKCVKKRLLLIIRHCVSMSA